MKFFSGFSLKNEEYLFELYLDTSSYTVSGFSYGAIKALNTTLKMIDNSQRVDRLQLLSPAFFQTKDEKFKRLQLMSYKKNELLYMKQFLGGCFYPYEQKIVENIETDISDLKELLEYEWSLETLKKIEAHGVKIEVYLGGKDAIIDADAAKEFFLEVSTVTYIKEANHFLQLS
ncbi:MAG: pimelyl-ACP methyl ester esterase BioV [Campylobacterota bacterium]|nr:pimelyl-ACP methyl ester esterase BioV [Campylobacterota bacterium]